MAADFDLNGPWNGWFDYTGRDERVVFTAWFTAGDGTVEGTSLEPNTFVATASEELEAEFSGEQAGMALELVKRYCPGQGAHAYPIAYAGEIGGDGNVISGTWHFTGGMLGAGRFRLERLAGGPKAVRRRRARLEQPVGLEGVSAPGKPR